MNPTSPHAPMPTLRPSTGGWRRPLAAMLCVLLVSASPAAAAASRDLADLSIEELMNENLHRSGATSFAEALRLVLGLNVATVNAADWAISSRGFSSLCVHSDGPGCGAVFTLELPFSAEAVTC